GQAALASAFRRMLLNVMAANCDDHSKNFSFILPEGGGWQLAPAYDVTHAYNPQGEWTYQHLMSVNGKFSGIGRADCLTVADRFGIGNAPRLIAEVAEAVARWPEFAARAKVGEAEMRRIAALFPAF
ncbi:type II toxin-antitoxin system HipA family toxin, partial [Accumulibacter sp.]|uniref:type II toxin-antitoxin system HipA family toxin n=1 Tax=Accumulibacter sp. TaxID=2053492 RepID=UPI0035AE6665